jgi:hypothetical protein
MVLYNDRQHQPNTERVTRGDGERDDEGLRALGSVPSFRWEFSNIATISFAFSIVGVGSSAANPFNTPLLLGGPASVKYMVLVPKGSELHRVSK